MDTLLPDISPPAPIPPDVKIGPDGVLDLPEDKIPGDVLYPQFANDEKRTEAFRLFMEGKAVLFISESLGVPKKTVVRWADKGGWLARKETEEGILRRHERAQIEEFRRERRGAALSEQHETARALRQKIKALIDSDVKWDPSKLKMLAEALKNAAAVESTSLGVSEAGVTAEETRDKEKGEGGKPPLIAVIVGNRGGLLGRVREQASQVIDV